MDTTDPQLTQQTPRRAGGASTRFWPVTMPSRLALVVATVLTGLTAGFFFTYSASVTLALADVGDATYVEVFKAINVTVRNPAFALVFFGSIPAIALAIAVNWKTAARSPRVVMAAALPLYLVGLLITGTGNVPLNDDLARVETTSPAVAAAARAAFENDWNRLNLVRALVFGASFAALAFASLLVSSDQSPARDSTGGKLRDGESNL